MAIALNAEKILALQTRAQKLEIGLFKNIDSTHTYLFNQVKAGRRSPLVCLAEAQTAGRGRQNKIWHSPKAVNIYCSILWFFAEANMALTGLNLVLSLAVITTLKHFAITQLGLKWPNDIWQQNQKIAGVLAEVVHTPMPGKVAIISVGLNVNAPPYPYPINQAWTCMEYAAKKSFNRNEIVAFLLDQLEATLSTFDCTALPAVLDAWPTLDRLYNKKIAIQMNHQQFQGIARGIDQQGHLIVDMNGKRRTFNSGDVSISLS